MHAYLHANLLDKSDAQCEFDLKMKASPRRKFRKSVSLSKLAREKKKHYGDVSSGWKGSSKSKVVGLRFGRSEPSKEVECAKPISGPKNAEAELSNRLIRELEHTGSDVRLLCESYGLRREELGRLTGFSLRALAEWGAGKLPSEPAQRRLKEIHRLLDALSRIVKAESIPAWLRKRNPAFDNMTPLQVIEVGEMDRLWEMIHEIGSGYVD